MALGKRSSLENKMNMYLTHEQELFCILPGKSFLENASACGDPNILACPIKRHIMEYYLKKGPSNCYFTLYFCYKNWGTLTEKEVYSSVL